MRTKFIGYSLLGLCLWQSTNVYAFDCVFPGSGTKAPGWVCDGPFDGAKGLTTVIGFGDSSISALAHSLVVLSNIVTYQANSQQSSASTTDGKVITVHGFGKVNVSSMSKTEVKANNSSNNKMTNIKLSKVELESEGCDFVVKLYQEQSNNESVKETQDIQMTDCNMRDVLIELKKANVTVLDQTVDKKTNDYYILVGFKGQ